MGWYDLFSNFYDRSLERFYETPRAISVEALRVEPGHTVLDLPCGTGQSLDGLARAVGPQGLVVGVDVSEGMIRRAQARARERGLDRVKLITADVHSLRREMVSAAVGRAVAVDRVHVFLGMSVFPRWSEAFERLWGVLAPGGRCVLVDVYAERLGLAGHFVNLVAQADIRRRFWEPLERVAEGFERTELPPDPRYGGAILLVTGTKAPLALK
jgi:ubiquinone/menaquinone biosynthesis C-methylase UbiE